jgi:hypothetical protein
MLSLKETQALTVYNKPFFVNEILAAIHPDIISVLVFDAMVKESRVYDLNTILTAMTRQIDISGFVPNLAGVYDDPQDVLEVLTCLGHKQLLKIAQVDAQTQEEIFNTLAGNRSTTLRALLVLDECQREVIEQLMQVRQHSQLAVTLRQTTEKALKDLYQHPENLSSSMFDEIFRYKDRLPIFEGEPRICYSKRVSNGAIVEVWQFFFMPKIKQIHLPAPFAHFTIGEVLNQMTPKIYQRELSDDDDFNPRSPAGFIGLLGKTGGALPRLIARQVKKNEQIRAQVMREQETAAALYEIFSR